MHGEYTYHLYHFGPDHMTILAESAYTSEMAARAGYNATRPERVGERVELTRSRNSDPNRPEYTLLAKELVR